MKLLLGKDVIGYNSDTNQTRLHASAGDVLFAVLRNNKPCPHYICEGQNYSSDFIPVFPNQVERYILEDDIHIDEEADFEPTDTPSYTGDTFGNSELA